MVHNGSGVPGSVRRCRELRIVIVDDESAFRTALAENLRDDGHPVVEYSRPDEIGSLAQLRGSRVAILEYRLPREDGVSFADRLHDAYPRVPVLLLTATVSGRLEERLKARQFLSMLVKPVDYSILHRTVHACALNSSLRR